MLSLMCFISIHPCLFTQLNPENALEIIISAINENAATALFMVRKIQA